MPHESGDDNDKISLLSLMISSTILILSASFQQKPRERAETEITITEMGIEPRCIDLKPYA